MMNAAKDLEIARLHSILDMDGLYIIRTDINVIPMAIKLFYEPLLLTMILSAKVL